MKERELRFMEVPPPKVIQFYAAVRFDVVECTMSYNFHGKVL
jgi:hypothetical protein